MAVMWTFEVWQCDIYTGHEKRMKSFGRYIDAARYVDKLLERNPWLHYEIIERYI